MELIHLYVPSINKYFVVQFAKMSKPEHFVGYHKDNSDVAPQFHLTCGPYTGAYLECFGPTGTSSMFFSAPYIMVKMDGRLGHQVQKTNFVGPRYSIVFFQLFNPERNECEDICYPPQYVS